MNDKLDGILLNNRSRLKDLFLKLTPNKEGCISFSDFTKFLKSVRIYPDLISAPDLNKLLKRLNSSSLISYTKFELIMKLIAEQSFNPMAPTFERIKMFIIHIRNYVKMHYQISLSINPAKKLLLETQEIRSTNKSTSPARGKNNSYKTLSRTNSISKGKISDILHNNWMVPVKKANMRKESPSISNTQLILTQKVNKNSSLNSTQGQDLVSERRKHQRSNSSQLGNKNVQKLILESFEKFKSRHENFVEKKINRSGLVKKHDQFIINQKNSNFSSTFFKGIIFNAWKDLIHSKDHLEEHELL